MIDTVDELRELYKMPTERALKKQLSQLDPHCRRYIETSPFLVIASCSASGEMDASPRGGSVGFVNILDDGTLLIPDEPGNNRLDTLTNVLATGKVGLIFMIPGVDETLRINGTARLNDDPTLRARFASEKRTPKLVIQVTITEAYLHCAKAFMRSKLWSGGPASEVRAIPTMGQMISDQTGAPLETQESMLARYQQDL